MSPRTHILVCHGCGTFFELEVSFLSSPIAVSLPSSTPGRTWCIPNHGCPDCCAESDGTPIVNGRHTGRLATAYDKGMSADAKARMLAQWPAWEPKLAALAESRR